MEILKDLGVFALISGCITILIRGFIGKYFDKKTELYKSELQKDLQQYKNDLDIHLTKVSKFHEKRLDVISELYKKISTLRITLADLTSVLSVKLENPKKDKELKEQRKVNAGESYQKFLEFYGANRIFIPKVTCLKIDELQSQAWSVLFDYHFREITYGNEFSEHSRKIIVEINERMREKIPAILNELEDDFRKSVDVETH